MAVNSYRDLVVWQKAMDLVVAVYRLTDSLPDRERFGLTNQMRRCAVSVPSNIAEGQGRGATQDYIRFLRIARGSVQELETQLMLAARLTFCSDADVEPLLATSTEVSRMLAGLERALSGGV